MAEKKTDKKRPKNLASALQVKPDQMAALMLLGHSYYESGKYQQAIDIFEGIQMLDSQNPYAPAVLGSIAQRQERFEDALEHFDRALEIYPNDVHSLVNRGECLLNLGRFQEAAKDLKGAIALDPGQQHPAVNRARLLVILTLDGLKLAGEKGAKAVKEAKKQLDQQLAL